MSEQTDHEARPAGGGEVDRRIAELHALLDRALNDRSDGAPAPPDGAGWEQLLRRVQAAADELAALRRGADESTRRLNDLMEMTVAIVSFDYSRRAHVGDAGDTFDAMAVGLNMLSEELQSSVVSKAYVNNILESMNDLLVVLDEEGTIMTLNQAVCRLSGHTKESLLGLPVAELFDDVLPQDIIANNGVRDAETTFRAKAGVAVPVAFSASVMRDVHDKIQGVVCVARDLTEAKRAEQERAVLHDAVRRQTILLEELSTPLIPITSTILVVPLIGTVDEERALRMSEALLDGIVRQKARVAILDLTGVRNLTAVSAHGLLRAIQAVHLIGAKAILTGVRPDLALMLMQLDVDLGAPSLGTLQSGIDYAQRYLQSKHKVAGR